MRRQRTGRILKNPERATSVSAPATRQEKAGAMQSMLAHLTEKQGQVPWRGQAFRAEMPPTMQKLVKDFQKRIHPGRWPASSTCHGRRSPPASGTMSVPA